MAGYIASIPAWFPVRKAAQVVAYFAMKSGGSVNVLKATKLVYLADRLSMDRFEYPITSDNLVSMPFGPVNSYTYSFMDGRADDFVDEWSEFVGKRVNNDIPLARNCKESDLDELSIDDLSILNDTWINFKDVDRFTLAEWTHRFCPEWRDPHGSSIPINFSTVFRILKKEDAVDLAEQIQAERSLRLELASPRRLRAIPEGG